MRGCERWICKSMDPWRGSVLRSCLGISLFFLIVASGIVEGQSDDDQALDFVFLERPPKVTSNTTATFRWQVLLASNGSDPCAVDACVKQCKLDNAQFENCSSQVAVYTNLTNAVHVFTILVSTFNGHFYSNETSWTVNTIHPTANLTTGAPLTNAMNISVGIQFSEPCISPGFQCPNVQSCNLTVKGPGVVVPSSLRVHTFGLEYSLIVALVPGIVKGRIVVKLGKAFCSDAAGNKFNRTDSAISIVHFSHTIPTVIVWTPTQDSQVQVDGEYRTISATNRLQDLYINLDFSEKMATTAAQLLSALQVSEGSLVPVVSDRNSTQRYFSFRVINVSNSAIISVSLPANSSFSLYGTPVVQTENITFFYDTIRPEVTISSTSLSKTKLRFIPCLIQFTEPVFVFGAQGLRLIGGNLTRFEEVSKTTYVIEVYIVADVVSVEVMNNVTYDVAGNSNFPSNVLVIRHYSDPAVAVALYSFTTAGLISTALASGALSISSAMLAAAGALGSQTSGSMIADPSRNLLGMATHLQVFALSDWVGASLPTVYRVTIRGLRWLIPHVDLPWWKHTNPSSVSNPLYQLSASPGGPLVKSLVLSRRKLLKYSEVDIPLLRPGVPTMLSTSSLTMYPEGCQSATVRRCSGRSSQQLLGGTHSHPRTLNLGCKDRPMTLSSNRGVRYSGRRGLGVNMTIYGPAFDAEEYAFYFDNDTSNIELRDAFDDQQYTGWRDFARNMFWVGAVGGLVILLHLLLLLLLRWKMETSVRGALTFPRFELFLLMLALPAICQAAAFIIRGGTTLGTIFGYLLLAIPAAVMLSLTLFLVVSIYPGSLVQYQVAIRRRQSGENEERLSRVRKWAMQVGGMSMAAIIPPKSVARWVRKDGLSPAFLPRYGLFFEDRKGPPKLVSIYGESGESFPKWVNGDGRIKEGHSDDESVTSVSIYRKIIGGARASYIIVDVSRRIALGVIFGAFVRSDKSWPQVVIALSFTSAQLLYLIIFKPYIKRAVQVVESISLLCETGLFVTVTVLLIAGRPYENHLIFGIIMLALLLLSFVVQLVNEWYALMKQLLCLSPTRDPSLKEGLKMFGKGLVLPLVPRKHWGRFINPHPHDQSVAGAIPVTSPDHERLDLEPELADRARHSTSIHTGSPLVAIWPEPAIPGYDPGSPAFIDPRNYVTEEAIVSGEIRPDVPVTAVAASGQGQISTTFSRADLDWGGQWSKTRTMEGKRSTNGANDDSKSSDMKMLREIAKASFPKSRRRTEIADPRQDIVSPVASNLGMAGAVMRNVTSSVPSRVSSVLGAAEEPEYSDGNSGSANNSSVAPTSSGR